LIDTRLPNQCSQRLANEMIRKHIQGKGQSDRVVKKCQRIAGLEALLKEWELSDHLDPDYVRGLKSRLLSVKNQLKKMSGYDGPEGVDDWVVSEHSRKRPEAKRHG
jgi:hypothetical protein